ncbi:MAG: type II toxin-antitoxin system Phd/YefM family antitoxin [Acidimicrobiia bacterium]
MASRTESVLSVTEATRRGLSRVVAEAESGTTVIVERHGRPAAVVVSADRMRSIDAFESELRTAAMVLARTATDDGRRSTLDEVIESLGFTRSELEDGDDDTA